VGRGVATFNVGSDGAAVGQANGATMTLLDILLAADGHATHATTAAGFALYAGDQATRNLAGPAGPAPAAALRGRRCR
jgi:hypothetical protein